MRKSTDTCIRKFGSLTSVTSMCCWMAVVAFGVMTPSVAGASPAPSQVVDVNPNSLTSGTLTGGRVVAFSVNPLNPQLVFAASELGGLWRSTNHGASWSHVDAVPLTAMQDVQIASSDTNLVIATGAYDGSTDNRGGGIWRSTDGGTTWAKAPGTDLCAPLRFNNARKVAIAPGTPGNLTVLVGMDCGIAKSTNSGASWTLVNPPGNNQIWDVKVRPVGGNLQVDACGDGGYLRSPDGGATWPTETDWTAATFPHPLVGNPPAPGNPSDVCRLATPPQDANTVLMATRSPVVAADGIGETFQLESDDGGLNWTNLNVSIDGNGRDPNAIISPAFDGLANHFEVYFMTDQMTMHQTCDTNNTPRCGTGTGTNNACANNNSGSWSTYDFSIPHCGTDPGDLAIDPTSGCPFLEGGDGGIFATTNGCTNSPTFTNANNGLHALWDYQGAVTAVPGGSAVNGAPHTSLYDARQDNGFNCSNDDGTTWHGCSGADAFNVFADPSGPPSGVLSNVNNGWSLHDEDGTTALSWTSPPQPRLDAAAQFGYQSYAFITDNKPSSGTPTYQVYVTTNAGSTWTQMGPNLPGPPAGAFLESGTSAAPVFYLELTVANTPTIYRLSGPLNGTASLVKTTGSGISSPSTYAVDPSDPQRLYAVDTAGSGSAKFSTNGGNSWTTDAALTAIVTKGGAYPFQTPIGANISAMGFDPNSNTILVGTNFTGVYSSTDNGADWSFVRGSEQIPRVATFAFDGRNAGRSYVSSAGRGMWRLQIPTADLSVTKSHTPEPATAGQQLTWNITVTNNGPDAAPDVTVTDTLPAHDTYLTNNLTPPSGCTVAGQKVTCSVGDLSSGQSVSFKIVTMVDANTVALAGGPTSMTNTVSVVSGGALDPNSANNTATDTALINDSADLSVSKLCKPDTNIYAGTPINCSVFVDNFGPSDARSVVIDDTVLSNNPVTLTNIAVSPGPTNCTTTNVTGGKKISCQVGTLPAASTTQTGRVTLTYTETTNEGGNLDDQALARSDTPDPDSSNNTATVNLTVSALADLALTKTATTTGVAGTAIAWNLSVHNAGPSKATNVVITDNVPAGVTINTVAMPGGTCTAGVPGDSTHPTVCTAGTLAASATSSTMTISATINPATVGTLHNDARVSSDTFDPNTADNLAHTDTTVTVQSSLAVAVSATPNPATAGTALSYRITVSNAGPSTATAIALSDPLPAGVTFTSTGGAGVCGYQTNTNTVTCQLPNLDPGASEDVFIYTMIKSSTLPGAMSNTATATGNGSPPASGSVSTNVVTSADLGIVLASDLNVYKPSTTIHYQITVTNTGPSDAQNVVVVQNLPNVKQGKYVSNNIGCAPPSGTTLTCQSPAVPALAVIPAGGTVTFQVNFYITGNKGTISSTATVSSATSDPVSSNNSSTRVVTVK